MLKWARTPLNIIYRRKPGRDYHRAVYFQLLLLPHPPLLRGTHASDQVASCLYDGLTFGRMTSTCTDSTAIYHVTYIGYSTQESQLV